MTPPRVFISYSQDSDPHAERVLNLSDRLRSEGVDCHIDQYEVSPVEGWPRWMGNRIRESEFVLVICSEKYKAKFESHGEPNKGLGGKWEGAIITQELYEAEGRNAKFIPVCFSEEEVLHIPITLRGATRYVMADDAESECYG